MKIEYKIFLVLFSVFSAAACAPLGSGDPELEQRVARQDIQLRQMQPRQADAMNQIEAMRQEINALKGQLNELNNVGGPKAIADRVRQHDQALRQVDNNMSLNLDLGAPIHAQPPEPAPALPDPTFAGVPMTGLQGVRPTGAPDSSAYGAARTSFVAPEPLTPTPAGSYGLPPDAPEARGDEIDVANGPSESKWGQADPIPEPTPQKDIATALFESGVNDFNSRDYGAAKRSFNDFIKNYPTNGRVAEAQYYLGECDFNSNQFPDAALAYEDVIKKYPKSASAPGAYLKQAICFSKMKQNDAARARMNEVIKKFPNSPEAARAKAFLQANK